MGSPGRRRHIPDVAVLRAYDVAESRKLRGIHVAHQDVRVVHAPNLIVVNIFRAHLADQPVHSLIGLLRNRFLHLHLQNQVRSALQVQAQLDLVAEIIFDLLDGGRERRRADQHVDTNQNHSQDEQSFPLQIGIHD